MGLIVVFMEVLFSVVLSACMASRIVPQKSLYHDCCSVSLTADEKLGCKWAASGPEKNLLDDSGVLHKFIWSECKEGGEPWRKWE